MSSLSSCRICHNKRLVKIGSLGKIAISDFTDKPSEGKKYPLTLVYCSECTLVQLDRNMPRDLLYKDYWYQSGLNPVIVKDLKEIAKYGRGIHVDIGANDGTLLKYSKAEWKVAVDPSNIKPEGVDNWIQDYWENTILKSVDIITAIACLYDLPNPNKFMARVRNALAENGLFICQFQPLSEMIELNDIGNICHEHLEYYSYKSLVYLFEQNDLEIFKVEKNKINGGSYRIFARSFQKGSINFEEKTYGIEELKDFFRRIEDNKRELKAFLHEAWLEKKQVYGYGASTKANTILQYYGISSKEIPVIIDVNPKKMGKFTIGTKILIVDNDLIKATDYLWVFPYGFIDFFKKKEIKYKGKWITTIPEFKIYDN